MGARVVELESQLITAADVNNLLQSTLQPITERLSRLEEAPMVSVAHAAKGAQGSTGESFSAVCAQLLEMRGKLAAVEQSVAEVKEGQKVTEAVLISLTNQLSRTNTEQNGHMEVRPAPARGSGAGGLTREEETYIGTAVHCGLEQTRSPFGVFYLGRTVA
jgi:hypothetical protein